VRRIGGLAWKWPVRQESIYESAAEPEQQDCDKHLPHQPPMIAADGFRAAGSEQRGNQVADAEKNGKQQTYRLRDGILTKICADPGRAKYQ
jgi:hypothetical protein